MKITHFTDELINEVFNGKRQLTQEERAFLISDTPSFEESMESSKELAEMDDIHLMRAAYRTWSDYANNQT